MNSIIKVLYLLCITICICSCRRLNDSVDVGVIESAFESKKSDTTLNFSSSDSINNPWTSNNCFMDAVLKCLSETGVLNDVITTDTCDVNYEFKKTIEEYRDCVKNKRFVSKDLSQKILRAYANYEIYYKFGEMWDAMHFFLDLVNVYQSLFDKFSIKYSVVCDCGRTTFTPQLFIDFNVSVCDNCKKDCTKLLDSYPSKYIVLNNVPIQVCKNNNNFEMISFKSEDGNEYNYRLISICVFDPPRKHYFADVKMPDGNYMRYDTLTSRNKAEIVSREKIFKYCNDSITNATAIFYGTYNEPCANILIYEYFSMS